MSERDKLHSGEIYYPSGDEIMTEQADCLEKQYDYNATRPSEGEKRSQLLKEMFAEIGKDCYIEPPLHSNWGGHHVHLGNNVYANFKGQNRVLSDIDTLHSVLFIYSTTICTTLVTPNNLLEYLR